jgi:ATP-dependent exoDNAse (exonuclease V) alpha subunit
MRPPVLCQPTNDGIDRLLLLVLNPGPTAAAAGVKLSKGQRAAVRVATTSPVLILTGGPGCGKTFTTATIVKLWSAMKKDMRLAAPTGTYTLVS